MNDSNNVLNELLVGKRPDFSRRVLFLDFDGPINLGGHYEAPEGECRTLVHKWRGIPRTGEWEDFIAHTINLSYYEEVARLFGGLNCVWITSWKDLTQSKLNPMLGYDFGYVDWKYRGPSDWGGHGKANAIGKIVKETGCDWLVVDDELGQFKDLIEHESGIAGEMICPDGFLGTSFDEMDEIMRLMTKDMHTDREPVKLVF